MKKLFLPLLAISILAFAYTETDVSNANYLATRGIITTQSTTAGYRLDDTITRAEAVGIALKIKGINLGTYQCKRYFDDTINNDWICRAVEIAADQGLVSRDNKTFRPQDRITRAEALAILIKSGGINIKKYIVPGNGDMPDMKGNLVFESKVQISWQRDIFWTYIDQINNGNNEFINNGNYLPNNNATRGEVFKFAKNILEYRAIMSGEVIVSNNGSSNTGLSSEIIIENGNLILYENGSRIRQITFDGKTDNNCGTGHNAQYTYVGKSGSIYLYDKRIYATCDSATSMRKIGVLNGIVFDIGEKIQNKYGIDLLMFPSSALYVVNDGQEKIIGFFSYDSSEFRQNIDTKLFIPIEKIQQLGIMVTQEPVASDGSIFGRGRPGKFEFLINLKQVLQ